MIEGVSVGVGSTGKGYNSENYDYQLFSLKSVSQNPGGIATVLIGVAPSLGTAEYQYEDHDEGTAMVMARPRKDSKTLNGSTPMKRVFMRLS